MKKWVARVLTVLLLLTTGMGALPEKTAKAADGVTIRVHYHRYDEAYDGWNLWIWPEGGNGAAYSFTEKDEFGMLAEVNFPDWGSLQRAGIIVRLNEWEAKDVESDRFMELSNAKNGVLDIYLVQGSMPIYYNQEEIDLSAKFLSAVLPTAKEIAFTVSVPVDTADESEKENYTVTDENGTEYAIKSIWSQSKGKVTSASVILEEKLDLTHSYKLTRKGYGSIYVSVGEAFSSTEFEEANTYEGELGAIYTKEKTTFRVWAPTASLVVLNLYEEGLGGSATETLPMTKDVQGTWVYEKSGDCNGIYYTYTVTVGDAVNEAVDPYARTTGANGERGMVIDLDATDPKGWEKDKKPELVNATDAIIYELHIRDLSSDSASGITNVGKFLGLTETGTKNSDGLATGLDHLKELGITHLHLLPVFDYASVDETSEEAQFNWGYDPQNYNAPEGSYSTDPYHGEVRVKEFKEMVQALHENGIRVVMDVVYNHTAATADSNFNKIVPSYYYRMDGSSFSNASGCGNETASERSMVRKFIVDSVVYWATEYHVDGFRFDLMGIHDAETLQAVRDALNEIDPTILVYGEGWTAGSSPYPEYARMLKKYMNKRDSGIAVFSDDIRDGLKGNVFEDKDTGFINGKSGMEETIKFGIVASTEHPQIDYSKIKTGTNQAWANAPTQTITYVSAHDNLTLWDKLSISNPDATEEERTKMYRLASAIVLTSQGIPFFQAGEEMLRSKPTEDGGVSENSYNLSDYTNSLKWDTKTTNLSTVNYYKGLIAFRKEHAGLRMTTTEEIKEHLTFLEDMPDKVVAFTITGQPNGEIADALLVVHNANRMATEVTIPEGKWDVYVNGETAGTKKLATVSGDKLVVEPLSSMVLVQGKGSKEGTGVWKLALAAAGVAVAAGAAAVALKRKKK